MRAPSTFRDALSKLQVSRRKTQAIRQAYMDSMEVAVRYYADVLIRSHFTFGNQGRLGLPDLSERYEAHKLRTVGVQPHLVSSGDLRNSVVGRGALKTNRPKYTVTLSFPDSEDYGGNLEEGSYGGPPRPWSAPTAADQVKIETKLQEEFRKRLKGIPAGRTMRKTK